MKIFIILFLLLLTTPSIIQETFAQYYYDEINHREPLVSSDYVNTPYAAILDSQLTACVGEMGKVFARNLYFVLYDC